MNLNDGFFRKQMKQKNVDMQKRFLKWKNNHKMKRRSFDKNKKKYRRYFFFNGFLIME